MNSDARVPFFPSIIKPTNGKNINKNRNGHLFNEFWGETFHFPIDHHQRASARSQLGEMCSHLKVALKMKKVKVKVKMSWRKLGSADILFMFEKVKVEMIWTTPGCFSVIMFEKVKVKMIWTTPGCFSSSNPPRPHPPLGHWSEPQIGQLASS